MSVLVCPSCGSQEGVPHAAGCPHRGDTLICPRSDNPCHSPIHCGVTGCWRMKPVPWGPGAKKEDLMSETANETLLADTGPVEANPWRSWVSDPPPKDELVDARDTSKPDYGIFLVTPSETRTTVNVAHWQWRHRGPEPAETKAADPIVADVVRRLEARSAAGMLKYGTGLDRSDLGLVAWLTHLQEELLDAACYVERLRSLLEGRQS